MQKHLRAVMVQRCFSCVPLPTADDDGSVGEKQLHYFFQPLNLELVSLYSDHSDNQINDSYKACYRHSLKEITQYRT